MTAPTADDLFVEIRSLLQLQERATLARIRQANGELGAEADADGAQDLCDGQLRRVVLDLVDRPITINICITNMDEIRALLAGALANPSLLCTTPSRPSEEPKDLSASVKAAGTAGTVSRADDGVANDTLADPEE